MDLPQSQRPETTMRRSVAAAHSGAYSHIVSFRRVLSLLVGFAVLLAPLGMASSAAAAAAPQNAVADTGGHCVGVDQLPKEQPPHKADCVVACSAILAERIDLLAARTCNALLERPLATVDRIGEAPEAATPPPRFS